MNAVETEVWDPVEALNRCWTTGSAADLRDYFHETMVAITPADRMPLLGREACVSAWTEYAETTKIISWQTHNPNIRVYGDTAIVTYSYEMRCERAGMSFRPSGRDMIVLVRDAGRWWVIADQFSPYPDGGDL
ncbi:nuclear transport factor 2 family protein [bacterium]|nr:nuclear transport factor 2 family protein [bacterium]MBU1074108.1 nuclear transport factor 2 family protein [bacterium]MBU1676026.1 nuclear transport factor 2 family protein [bacterium]